MVELAGVAVTARCRSCGCDLQPWESEFCEGCGPLFLPAMKGEQMSKQMSREQQSEVRAIVDRAGWDGLREQRPDLWQAICLQRQRDRAYIDAVLRDN